MTEPVQEHRSDRDTPVNEALRLLICERGQVALDDIGFDPEVLQEIRKSINAPNGIVIVSGPTGSGKSTTLYAFLSEVNTPEKNVVTLEDPVEYRMESVNQGQANPKAGFTFAGGLRSILRQDPDVIMVGEIRDQETAHIAMEASPTGHLVFSTLQTLSLHGLSLVEQGLTTIEEVLRLCRLG